MLVIGENVTQIVIPAKRLLPREPGPIERRGRVVGMCRRS